MNWRILKAILILPGTALVLVPVLVVLATRNSRFASNLSSPSDFCFWLAIVLFLAGLSVAVWTVSLFARSGKGTPAPWDPPQRLVVAGPYRFVRNPMITGAITILAGESLLLQSWPLAVWLVIFFIGNAIYFPLFEEPALRERFGDQYRLYAANVPRWLPRLRPWNLPDQ
jgi:protein-S-isoprenylcysteine O-methyltransferase Ste14